MSDSFDATKFQALADFVQANPKAQSALLAMLGLKSQETENPAPRDDASRSQQAGRSTADDLNAGKVSTSNDEQVKSDLDPVRRAPVETSSDILAFLPDYALPRHISHEENSFVPNFNGIYAILHEMNLLVAQKFRALRHHQAFNPYLLIFYFSFCSNLQVARCLRYANQLEHSSDISALDTFLSRFPAEKFPIPGPLLAIFKTITTYKVQNALHSRVSPRFPNFYIRPATTEFWHQSQSNQLFPYHPAVVELMSRAHTIYKRGQNPSFEKPWPFEWKDAADTADTDLVKATTFLGITIAESALNALGTDVSNIVLSPASYRAPLVTDDIAKKAQPFSAQIKFPSSVNGGATSLAQYLGIESFLWPKTMLRYITEYTSLWEGNGTLADCSVDGPAFGAYIQQYHAVGTDLTSAPLPLAFQGKGIFEMSANSYSTQGSPEPLVERMSAISQVHAHLGTGHWSRAADKAHRYNGNVWSIRPVYGPSSDVYFYDTIDDYVEKMMSDKFTK